MDDPTITEGNEKPVLYDANGEVVEGALLPDQAKLLTEQVGVKEEELNKLREKDLNFSKFRAKTKAEQSKIREEMSSEQRMLLDELEDLRGQMTKRDEATLGKFKEGKLEELAGGDSTLKEKLETEFSRLGETPYSKEEISNQFEDAMAIIERRANRGGSVSPMGQHMPTTPDSPWSDGKKKKNYADTDEGKGFAKDLGLDMEAPKKQ